MPQAVIMAGGQGERFWPVTHAGFPKYRLRVGSGRSLLRGTYERLRKVFPSDSIHVVTTRDHLSNIRKELPKVQRKNWIVEPFRNNTAAAIYLSTRRIAARFGMDETVSFFPADHLIKRTELFRDTIRTAIATASKEDALVTIGIKPTFAATGYGYIEAGPPVRRGSRVLSVKGFFEKPDPATAKQYLKKKVFYWNAGIFTWRAGVFLLEMNENAPEFDRKYDPKRLERSYETLPNTSIDYALLEKTRRIVLVRTRMDWCDMGNWDMYAERHPGASSRFPVHSKDCSRTLLMNESQGRPLVVVGLDDVVVVQTDRGTLVCRRGRAEEATLHLKNS